MDINTFFRVSSNLVHFHCSQRALRARMLACIGYLSGLAFILPLSFHLTLETLQESKENAFPLLSPLPVCEAASGPWCLLPACSSISLGTSSQLFPSICLPHFKHCLFPSGLQCMDSSISVSQVLGGKISACVLPKSSPHICSVPLVSPL